MWAQVLSWAVVTFIVIGIIGAAAGGGNKKKTAAVVTSSSSSAATTTIAPTTSTSTTTTTTTIATTVVVDPLQAVRTITAGDCERLTSADVTADSGVYTARSKTDGDAKDQARDCVSNILRNVKAAGIPPGWSEMTVHITADLQNQYGEVTKDSTVITAVFSVETVQRIQYDNIDTTKILTFATSKTVHPAFAKDDGS